MTDVDRRRRPAASASPPSGCDRCTSADPDGPPLERGRGGAFLHGWPTTWPPATPRTSLRQGRKDTLMRWQRTRACTDLAASRAVGAAVEAVNILSRPQRGGPSPPGPGVLPAPGGRRPARDLSEAREGRPRPTTRCLGATTPELEELEHRLVGPHLPRLAGDRRGATADRARPWRRAGPHRRPPPCSDPVEAARARDSVDVESVPRPPRARRRRWPRRASTTEARSGAISAAIDHSVSPGWTT